MRIVSMYMFELVVTGRLDAGRYKCSANNGVGNPVTKTIHLTVLCE